jgi:hypothetical protein
VLIKRPLLFSKIAGTEKTERIYYKSSLVEDADIKSFKIFNKINFESYAYDNRFYYFYGQRISNEEAKSKGLDKLKE